MLPHSDGDVLQTIGPQIWGDHLIGGRGLVGRPTWRERVKAGPLSGLYALVREGKRRMLGQPLAGYVPRSLTPLPIGALRALSPVMSDHSRLQYSLALAYLGRGLPGDHARAAEHLDRAAELGFDSRERVALHQAQIAGLRGEPARAARLLAVLGPGDLTDEECAQAVRLGAFGDAPARVAPQARPAPAPEAKPRVSAIVPNYNYGHYLKERMRSILRQTVSDLELLYVDDASTDESNRFAQDFAADPRVRLRFCERNSGTVYQRWNEAAREARGEWLWFANADDSAHPRFLERLLALVADRPGVAIVHSEVALIDGVGRLLSAGLGGSPEVAARLGADLVNRGSDEVVSVTGGLYLRTASAMILRREAFLEAGGFDVRLWGAADYDLYLRILHCHDLAYAAEPLAYYRQHGSNATRLTNPIRHSLALAYAFACAYLRMEGDPRYTDSMREAVRQRTGAQVFDLFAGHAVTIPERWRFAVERIHLVVPDRRLLALPTAADSPGRALSGQPTPAGGSASRIKSAAAAESARNER